MNKRSTKFELDGTKEAYVTSWKQAAGWYACVSGTTTDGLYFEGEDFGPENSRGEAEDAARNHHIRGAFMDEIGFGE